MDDLFRSANCKLEDYRDTESFVSKLNPGDVVGLDKSQIHDLAYEYKSDIVLGYLNSFKLPIRAELAICAGMICMQSPQTYAKYLARESLIEFSDVFSQIDNFSDDVGEKLKTSKEFFEKACSIKTEDNLCIGPLYDNHYPSNALNEAYLNWCCSKNLFLSFLEPAIKHYPGTSFRKDRVFVDEGLTDTQYFREDIISTYQHCRYVLFKCEVYRDNAGYEDWNEVESRFNKYILHPNDYAPVRKDIHEILNLINIDNNAEATPVFCPSRTGFQEKLLDIIVRLYSLMDKIAHYVIQTFSLDIRNELESISGRRNNKKPLKSMLTLSRYLSKGNETNPFLLQLYIINMEVNQWMVETDSYRYDMIPKAPELNDIRNHAVHACLAIKYYNGMKNNRSVLHTSSDDLLDSADILIYTVKEMIMTVLLAEEYREREIKSKI